MVTVGWILILFGTLLISAALRGRAMNITKDVPDAFVALLSADPKGLQEVLTRKAAEVNRPLTAEEAAQLRNAGAEAGAGLTDLTGAVVGHYKLGKVKSNVELVANSVGPKYGIKVAYGYSATGSVPDSDHPKGLAVDFMTPTKEAGDKLAADLVKNASTYGIKYVIWWGRINTLDGRGWRTYIGPRNHHDHVHASFREQAISADPAKVK